MDGMKQEAAYPHILEKLVESLKYRPGWIFELRDRDRGQGSNGLTLEIYTKGYDSYHPENGEHYRVVHYMPVPPANYNEQSWKRWLLEQCLLVERHECCEFFKIGGKRPYKPAHGPGWDPYIILDEASPVDKRTMYTGKVLNERRRESEGASAVEGMEDEARKQRPGEGDQVALQDE